MTAMATVPYEGVEKMIYKLTHNFIRRHGEAYGTWDELVSVANADYVLAMQKFDPNRGMKLTSFIYWVISKGFAEHVRRTIRQRSRMEYVDMTGDERPGRQTLDRLEFLDEFSGDAQAVIKLIWDAPEDLSKVLRDGGKVTQLRQYLMGRFDWDQVRINEIFNEIRRALG